MHWFTRDEAAPELVAARLQLRVRFLDRGQLRAHALELLIDLRLGRAQRLELFTPGALLITEPGKGFFGGGEL